LTSLSFYFLFVFETTLYAPAPLIRRTLREVLLDIYSRTSCSWRSLSPNFPENWKNMLLNAFLLTYVWNFVILSSGRSRNFSLSLSFSHFLSPVLHSLFLLVKSLLQFCCALHYISLTRFMTQSSVIAILSSATF